MRSYIYYVSLHVYKNLGEQQIFVLYFLETDSFGKKLFFSPQQGILISSNYQKYKSDKKLAQLVKRSCSKLIRKEW